MKYSSSDTDSSTSFLAPQALRAPVYLHLLASSSQMIACWSTFSSMKNQRISSHLVSKFSCPHHHCETNRWLSFRPAIAAQVSSGTMTGRHWKEIFSSLAFQAAQTFPRSHHLIHLRHRTRYLRSPLRLSAVSCSPASLSSNVI